MGQTRTVGGGSHYCFMVTTRYGGQTLDFTIAFIRRFPRWFGAISFALDEAEDDFGISLSIWPEGLPQAALGSRRFTGVTNITRLRRD